MFGNWKWNTEVDGSPVITGHVIKEVFPGTPKISVTIFFFSCVD